MTTPIEVSDAALDPERLQTLAATLKRSSQKLLVFKAAYSGKRKAPVDALFLSQKTGLSKKRVTEIATGLARLGFLTQEKSHSGRYKRIPRITEYRGRLIRLASNSSLAARQVTMRTPKNDQKVVQVLRIPSPRKPTVIHVTIDDVKEFGKIKSIKNSQVDLSIKPLKEKNFKSGLHALMPGTDLFKDWGGERNDLFGQHLTLRGKRVKAAFALKGPFKNPPLTPGKMGQNGDQIQRLVFQAPANLFVIQYEGKIEISVYEQLEMLIRAKASLTGEKLYYCIIDHFDSARLRLAYPKVFK